MKTPKRAVSEPISAAIAEVETGDPLRPVSANPAMPGYLDASLDAPKPVATVATVHGTLTELDLEASIARLTRRMTTATDEEIAELVVERRAMRGELEELRRVALPDNVTRIDQRRGV